MSSSCCWRATGSYTEMASKQIISGIVPRSHMNEILELAGLYFACSMLSSPNLGAIHYFTYSDHSPQNIEFVQYIETISIFAL